MELRERATLLQEIGGHEDRGVSRLALPPDRWTPDRRILPLSVVYHRSSDESRGGDGVRHRRRKWSEANRVHLFPRNTEEWIEMQRRQSLPSIHLEKEKSSYQHEIDGGEDFGETRQVAFFSE